MIRLAIPQSYAKSISYLRQEDSPVQFCVRGNIVSQKGYKGNFDTNAITGSTSYSDSPKWDDLKAGVIDRSTPNNLVGDNLVLTMTYLLSYTIVGFDPDHFVQGLRNFCIVPSDIRVIKRYGFNTMMFQKQAEDHFDEITFEEFIIHLLEVNVT